MASAANALRNIGSSLGRGVNKAAQRGYQGFKRGVSDYRDSVLSEAAQVGRASTGGAAPEEVQGTASRATSAAAAAAKSRAGSAIWAALPPQLKAVLLGVKHWKLLLAMLVISCVTPFLLLYALYLGSEFAYSNPTDIDSIEAGACALRGSQEEQFECGVGEGTDLVIKGVQSRLQQTAD